MTFIPPTRRSRQLADIELSCLEWQGKTPLLLLHGLADNALVWANLGESLKEKYHVIAPDLRGHGNSSKPQSGYKFNDYITDLNALCDQLGWQQAHVLGHSWGAKLAAIWATQQPERFKSLILADPFFIGSIPSWWRYTFPIGYRVLPFLKLLGSFSSYQQAEAIAKNLKQYRGWNEWQAAIFQASLEKNSDGKWQSKFQKPACDKIFLDVLKVNGLTHELEMPSLFLQPKDGLNRLELQFKPYHKYLKNLQWQMVSGNHWAHIVEPESFNQAIATFLESID